jgi:hypothetical protein
VRSEAEAGVRDCFGAAEWFAEWKPMRAPVYRSIEGGNTFLGLAFPSEVLVVLLVFWVGMLLAPPGPALLATVGMGVAMRLASIGRPPQYLQHLLLFHFRRLRSGGRFNAGARAAAQPRFPFAAYRFRDARRRHPLKTERR